MSRLHVIPSLAGIRPAIGGRFDEALAAYEASLVNDPKRLRSFYGAARAAAAAAGNKDKARYYFSRIVDMADARQQPPCSG
jgi:tetratricopeptide (TPR) repeat protein